MKLILISNPNDIKDEIKHIISLFQNGLTFFHLRKEKYSKYDYYNLLNKIPKEYHKYIIISHFQELIYDFNLKGIHFSENERFNNKHLNFKINRNIIKTTSFHNVQDIDDFFWDFYYLSPFFDSISKPNYKQNNFLIEHLDKKKLIALGGINCENINKLKEKKIQNFGILGSVWNFTDNYVNNFLKLKSIL